MFENLWHIEDSERESFTGELHRLVDQELELLEDLDKVRELGLSFLKVGLENENLRITTRQGLVLVVLTGLVCNAADRIRRDNWEARDWERSGP